MKLDNEDIDLLVLALDDMDFGVLNSVVRKAQDTAIKQRVNQVKEKLNELRENAPNN